MKKKSKIRGDSHKIFLKIQYTLQVEN